LILGIKLMDENTQKPRIQNNPSIKKAEQQIKLIKAAKRGFPYVKPIFKLLKADVPGIESTLNNTFEKAKSMELMLTIPDRFNDLFSTRGWIFYEMMNVEIARKAVEKAEGGDIEGAENDLVDYFNPEMVEVHLGFMNAVKAFRPRIILARKALTDYREERYHACVPVILAQLDGLVNDLNNVGFFAKGVDLTAWDSLAGHSSGLSALAQILAAKRTTINTGKISIPYRHGIQHGMDLGYDNKMVAAKTWAALFAIRDWAIKAEKGELKGPKETKPPTSFREVLNQLKENEADKARLESWEPRVIQTGKDFPTSGEPEEYVEGSPEQELAKYLYNWKTKRYGLMVGSLPKRITNKTTTGKLAGELKTHYSTKNIKSFEILTVTDNAAAVTTIKTKLIYEEDSKTIENIIDFRLLYEDQSGKTMIRGKPGGNWVIYNYLVFNP